jgi:hemerythrin-like domain-containing protein
MSTISEFMTPDHSRCDDYFAKAEAAAANGDWSACHSAFNSFVDATQHHFAMEEEVLFPSFEARTGMTMGPTQMMRMEHRQMSDLIAQMVDAVQQQNQGEFLGLSETLLMIMQQHNLKEEQMLYRMADEVLGGEIDTVIGQMKNIAT